MYSKLIFTKVGIMYVTGLLVAGNKLLRLGVAVHVEMTGITQRLKGVKGPNLGGREGCLDLKL